MDNVPDDVLCLVFESYVHRLGYAPANLLTICHRWHSLLLSIRSIWSRLPIHVTSFETLPYILNYDKSVIEKEVNSDSRESEADNVHDTEPDGCSRIPPQPSPLCTYLERSHLPGSSSGHPLNLSIVWHGLERWESDEVEKKHLSNLKERHIQIFYLTTTRKHRYDRCRRQMEYLLRYLCGKDTEWWRDDYSRFIVTPAETWGNRWKALEIDLGDLSPWLRPQLRLPTEKLGLEKLCLRGLDFFPVEMHALRHLDIREANFAGWFPDIGEVETMTLLQGTHDYTEVPCWEQLNRLRTIRLTKPSSLLDYLPPPGSLPALTTIILQGPSHGLERLDALFNSSRPLQLLALAEESIQDVANIFLQSKGFYVKTIKLSSVNFPRRPKSWKWDEYGTVTWDVSEWEVKHARTLLNHLNEIGADFEPMDAQMEAILRRGWHESEFQDKQEAIQGNPSVPLIA